MDPACDAQSPRAGHPGPGASYAPRTPNTSRPKLGLKLSLEDLDRLDELLADDGKVAGDQLPMMQQTHGAARVSPSSNVSTISCGAGVEVLKTPMSRGSDGCRGPQKERSWLARFEQMVVSERFNFVMGILITLNMVTMGIELDMHPYAKYSSTMFSIMDYPRIPLQVFDGLEGFFFVVFSIELCMRVAARRAAVFREPSTYIDAISLLPVVLEVVFDLNEGKHLMLLRVVRLMKLTRMIRLIRSFKELHFLVKSIFSAMQTLVWIGLLLLIALYCAAIVCTMLIGHNESFAPQDQQVGSYQTEHGIDVEARRYWGSIARSMMTLFQIFTLDNWSVVVRPIIETHQPWMFLFFVAFIFVTSFGLLNLLMGAIVDHTMSVAREADLEREQMFKDDHKRVLLAAGRLFSFIDSDCNGILTSNEIVSFLSQHDIQEVLQKDMASFNLKIDYGELSEIFLGIAEDWLSADDGVEGDGISMEEFVGAAMRLQGPAKSKDLLATLIASKSAVLRVEAVDRSLQQLHARVEAQSDMIQRSFEELRRRLPYEPPAVHAPHGGDLKHRPTPASQFAWHSEPFSSVLPPIPSASSRPASTCAESSCEGSQIAQGSQCDGRTNAREAAPGSALYRSPDKLQAAQHSDGRLPCLWRSNSDPVREEAEERDDADLSPKLIPLRSERLALRKTGSRGLNAVLASINQDRVYAHTEMAAAFKPYSRHILRSSSTTSMEDRAHSRHKSAGHCEPKKRLFRRCRSASPEYERGSARPPVVVVGNRSQHGEAGAAGSSSRDSVCRGTACTGSFSLATLPNVIQGD